LPYALTKFLCGVDADMHLTTVNIKISIL
jgi:hypothetical protein